jgi:hypothetical protein
MLFLNNYLLLKVVAKLFFSRKYTHTHTHIYIYIFIFVLQNFLICPQESVFIFLKKLVKLCNFLILKHGLSCIVVFNAVVRSKEIQQTIISDSRRSRDTLLLGIVDTLALTFVNGFRTSSEILLCLRRFLLCVVWQSMTSHYDVCWGSIMSVEFTILFIISDFLSLKNETFLVVGRRQVGDEQSTWDAENCALLGY